MSRINTLLFNGVNENVILFNGRLIIAPTSHANKWHKYLFYTKKCMGTSELYPSLYFNGTLQITEYLSININLRLFPVKTIANI